MDNVTPQNAALVEEAAAAAQSLQDQTTNLSEIVAVFKTGEAKTSVMVAAKLIKQAARPLLIATRRLAPFRQVFADQRGAAGGDAADAEGLRCDSAARGQNLAPDD